MTLSLFAAFTNRLHGFSWTVMMYQFPAGKQVNMYLSYIGHLWG